MPKGGSGKKQGKHTESHTKEELDTVTEILHTDRQNGTGTIERSRLEDGKAQKKK